MDIGNLGTWALEKAEAIISNRIGRHPLEFTKIDCSYTYSHYEGQNHVRQGGEKRICSGGLALTVQNRGANQRMMCDVTLECVINNVSHKLALIDVAGNGRKEDYNIPASTVSRFSWNAGPNSPGFRNDFDGFLPFEDGDLIVFQFSYRDEKRQLHLFPIVRVERRRVDPLTILA